MKSCLEQSQKPDASNHKAVSTNDVDLKVMNRLRTATRPEHEALEQVDFNCRLARGAISASEYAALMEIHRIVHEALETILPAHASDKIQSVWRDHQAKLDLIDRDTNAFPLETSDFDEAITRAGKFVESIRAHADARPDWLLGIFYVVEGSTLGGMFLRPRIAEGLGCAPDDLHYYGAYGRETKRRWVEFTERMDRAFVDASAVARCVQGGKDAFDAYRRIFEALSEVSAIDAAS